MSAGFKPLFWFVVVGCTAALVHLGVVWAMVEQLRVPPLAANVLAFCVAFCVSFLGHHGLSFAAQNAPRGRAAARFLLVALLGFVLNETLYAILLRLGWDYRFALVLVLGLVAVCTFVLARLWAFAGPGRNER
jgi:putative flippase GtrA